MLQYDAELLLLQTLNESEGAQERVTQRKLALRAGLSLGMTNLLCKRLAERSWIKLTRLSPKSMRYALTPEGVGEIIRRTSEYFRRAAQDADKHYALIEHFVLGIKRTGVGTIVLVGESELDFLIDLACERHGVAFLKTTDPKRAQSVAKRSDVIVLCADNEATLPHRYVRVRDIATPSQAQADT